jgi:hypothetical protein
MHANRMIHADRLDVGRVRCRARADTANAA